MPELPEVEVTCRNVARWTAGHRLARLAIDDPAVLRAGDPSVLGDVRVGPAFRRAKLCVIPLGKHVLVIHLRMTGKLVRFHPDRRAPRLRLILADGPTLAFEDVRRLGQAWLLEAPSLDAFFQVHAPGAEPWPEPRDGDWLRAVLAGKRGAIKPSMMDGSRISGVGNIGASESCWHAGLAPERPVPSLDAQDWARLARGLTEWIEATLAAEDGDEIVYVQHGGANPFQVYGRAGDPCRRCGRPIVRSVQSGRATFACAGCQS